MVLGACARSNFPVWPGFLVLCSTSNTEKYRNMGRLYILYCAQATVNVSNFWLESTKFIYTHHTAAGVHCTTQIPNPKWFRRLVWFFGFNHLSKNSLSYVTYGRLSMCLGFKYTHTHTFVLHLQALITHQLSQLNVCASVCECILCQIGRILRATKWQTATEWENSKSRSVIPRKWRSTNERYSIIRF